MGILQQLKKNAGPLAAKAQQLAAQHEGQIRQGIDKAARLADSKTAGKHHAKITKVAGQAQQAVAKVQQPRY